MDKLLKPSPMKLFYLTFPSKYEDRVIEAVGDLRAVQPIREYAIKGFSKVDNIEKCERYVKLQQRINTVLSTIAEKPRRKSLLGSLRESLAKPRREARSARRRLRRRRGRLDRAKELFEAVMRISTERGMERREKTYNRET
ncbi:MAG: hypothetical protein QW390_04305 [Candidatus Bathyarchaeia archaeon]